MLIATRTVEETLALGKLIGRLAPAPPESTCIALDGQLGAGKTHLTRGIAQGAQVLDPTLVSSPTYVLLNIYEGPKPVYHLDAYRINSLEDFQAVGFEELLGGNAVDRTHCDNRGGVVVVEWAQRIRLLLPDDHLQIVIQPGDQSESHRLFEITGMGPRSRLLADRLRTAWPG
jgi:tRNA threonylcarbamoyladenosine biosynthesis protein TsaE